MGQEAATITIAWEPDKPFENPHEIRDWLKEKHRETAHENDGTSYLGICRHFDQRHATLVLVTSALEFESWLDANEHLYETCELNRLDTLN